MKYYAKKRKNLLSTHCWHRQQRVVVDRLLGLCRVHALIHEVEKYCGGKKKGKFWLPTHRWQRQQRVGVDRVFGIRFQFVALWVLAAAVLQCVAVWCSALQCVAVCCNVLQCAAVCCGELQCDTASCTMPVCVCVCVCVCTCIYRRYCGYSRPLCCSVLQCVAVCCSV